MHYSYFVAAITLIASLFRADAIPNTKLGTMSSIRSKDCPKFSGITLDFMVVRDAESINKNTYIFDGTLFFDDGAYAGQVSIGCQRSPFLSDTVMLGAGIYNFEVVLIENDEFLAVVVAEGTTIFGFANSGSTVTITGGTDCALGAIGHIDMVSEKITLALE